jgi:hypothetical protein
MPVLSFCVTYCILTIHTYCCYCHYYTITKFPSFIFGAIHRKMLKKSFRLHRRKVSIFLYLYTVRLLFYAPFVLICFVSPGISYTWNFSRYNCLRKSIVVANIFYNTVACRLLARQEAAKQTTIQYPLLNNNSANKYVSKATREHSSNGRDIFYAVRAEVL